MCLLNFRIFNLIQSKYPNSSRFLMIYTVFRNGAPLNTYFVQLCLTDFMQIIRQYQEITKYGMILFLELLEVNESDLFLLLRQIQGERTLCSTVLCEKKSHDCGPTTEERVMDRKLCQGMARWWSQVFCQPSYFDQSVLQAGSSWVNIAAGELLALSMRPKRIQLLWHAFQDGGIYFSLWCLHEDDV